MHKKDGSRSGGCGGWDGNLRSTAMTVDDDPQEPQGWLEALDSVLFHEGRRRVENLIERVVDRAQAGGVHLPHVVQTPYINTIPVSQQPAMPGNPELEARLRHYV